MTDVPSLGKILLTSDEDSEDDLGNARETEFTTQDGLPLHFIREWFIFNLLSRRCKYEWPLSWAP